ncbi:MAG: RnfABCDGE type electron transport complex subunit D [Oscillospiraceae bacterium]
MDLLTVAPSPHIRGAVTTQKIMLLVIIALLPAFVMSVVFFGPRALILTGFCAAACYFLEFVSRRVMKRADTTGDLSAIVTGMLLAFNLPSTLPLWMAFIGCFVAIVIVKQLFGGLGQNFANPAITGRIVLMVSFPAAMVGTTPWAVPFSYNDGIVTSPTPLADTSFSYFDLFIGKCGGSLGETSAAALLLGGIFLVAMRVINPVTPLAFIGGTALFSLAAGEDPLYQILAGGLMLGAIFMATDYVTTPITTKGKLIFGLGCAVITCLVRFYSSMPEGVSFSILLMNILTPYIDMATRTKAFGTKQKEAQK